MKLWPMFRDRAEVAALRDRCIIAETKAILLADIVNNTPRKPVRERRKDSHEYQERAALRRRELEAFKSIATYPRDELREGR